MKFGMAVALMRYNVELWRNGGGANAFAKHQTIFLPFLAKLEDFKSSERNLYFFRKKPLIF